MLQITYVGEHQMIIVLIIIGKNILQKILIKDNIKIFLILIINIMLKKLILIDLTTNQDHKSIKNKAIGASEYQTYSLIEKLSSTYDIICYNNKDSTVQIDNITYKSWKKNLLLDHIDSDTKIIIQRMLPNQYSEIYNKIKNNKILLWIHDLTERYVFLFNYNEDERNIYNDIEMYKNNILKNFYENKNIHYVFVSNFIKDKFKNYFKDHGFDIENNRLNVIYNILYEDEYINVKKSTIEVNKNYITYASAWQKGIEHVVNVFDHVKKEDNSLKLVLLSPGYDWNNFKSYAEELKNKYSDSIIIHGPVNKEQLSKIIKESMVVLTTTFAETFGCVFAESYYLGTPVIADYRSGGVKEIIDNNFIVNFDNKKETVDKILFIKKNRNEINVNLDNKFMLEYNINLWLNLIK
jgi:glycosyltransferase involved in cell wall biosynthesis